MEGDNIVNQTQRTAVFCWLAAWYLIAILFFTWPYYYSKRDRAAGEPRKEMVMIGVLLLGALGSVVTCTRSYVSGRDSEKTTWYLFSPFMGMLMASFCYVAMRAGYLATTYEPPSNYIANANIYYFAAVMSGLFCEKAYQKFAELADTLFQLRKDYETATEEVQIRRGKMEVQPALSGGMLHEVFRFRYKILIEEEQVNILSADHRSRTVQDDYDEIAYILVALSDSSEVAGTARTVLWRSLPNSLKNKDGIPETLANVGFALPPSIKPDMCSYTSRMVTSGDSKRTKHLASSELAKALYYFGLRSGIEIDFILCTPDVVRFFKKLGYRELIANIKSPDTQRQCYLMYLLLEDSVHLGKVRSPFEELCPETPPQRCNDVRWIMYDFAKQFRLKPPAPISIQGIKGKQEEIESTIKPEVGTGSDIVQGK
jgi:N-acyl-L-homoserine lactone synthetase